MKVLMLDPLVGNPYGPDLASALWNEGVDIRLLVPVGFTNQERTKCPYEEISPRGGRGRLVQKIMDELRYVLRVWDLARKWRPDVIHIQWLRMSAEARLIPGLRSLDRRIVVTAHNVFPHERRPGDQEFQRRYYGSADRVIVHEPCARAELVDVLGISPEKVDIVPHGIPEGPATAVDRRLARKRLGIDESATTFLLFGGVRPYKGYDTLLRAFELAASRGGRGQLVFGGWGSSHSVRELRDRVESLGPNTRKRIHLHVREDTPLAQEVVNDLFAACDCVALPYKTISQSSVLFQALDHERAVLASSIGGFLQVVEDGFNGRLVEAENERGWADALSTLAEDPNLLQEWGRNGRRRAVENWGHSRVAQQTIAAYERAIRNVTHE